MPPSLIPLQASLPSIGKHIHYLAGSDPLLNALPELDVDQVPMKRQEVVPYGSCRDKKGLELLRKYIELTHVEPWLGRELVFDRARLRNTAKVVIGEQTELVVVIADHATVPAHTEVLEQHVTGEDICRRQVLDRVPIVEYRLARGLLVGLNQK